MARRLYLGHLPPEARSEDIQKLFDGYGRVVDCRVMNGKGFGFVEFESSRDAEDAVHSFNGKEFMGSSIVVEFAKEARRRDPRDDERGPPPRARRPPGFRVIVSGLSRDTSWQDLKDFGREAGSVSFADIDRDYPGDGILEYLTRDDADAAVKVLDNKELRGNVVRVALGGEREYRRDDRPPRDNRYRGDPYRRGGDRYSQDDRDRGYSERSRSPRRGGHERRRSPPPRRDYEEGRMEVDERRYDERPRYENGRYEDRRGRDDERAPPKRRDDTRFEDENGGRR